MLLDTPHARLTLRHNELARVVSACNTRVDCIEGTAWITIDGDRRDVVLTRGQSFVVDSSAPLLVHAIQGPAAVELRTRRNVVPCRPAPAATRRWRDWFAQPGRLAAGAA